MPTTRPLLACTAPFAKPWRVLPTTLLMLLLAACGTPPPPPPVVTNLQMSVIAAFDTNPDARKRASPVVVRFYALKSTAAFDSADFFSLFEKDTATLGTDLVQKEEFLMTPGQQKVLTLKFEPEVKAVAVMAAFRDLENARWRAVQVLYVGRSLEITAKLLGSQIMLDYKVLSGPPTLPQAPKMPSMPEIPKMPKMPEMPKAPEVPKMPELPKMPSMPSFKP